MNIFIEGFKILQRIVMVLLTLALLMVMSRVCNEIYSLKETVSKVELRISNMNTEINSLNSTLKRNWLFK